MRLSLSHSYLKTVWVIVALLTGLASRGEAKAALDFPYFPSRMHAFIWRNWTSVSIGKMALVLGTTKENVNNVAKSMGLPDYTDPSPYMQDRGYITTLRRNWHLLPNDQLLVLLGWDMAKLDFTLKEDDFLFIKFGSAKPDCAPLKYAVPTAAMDQRSVEIKAVVANYFGNEWNTPPKEQPFAFIEKLSTISGDTMPVVSDPNEKIRFLYSYFAVYGDALLNVELDPYPDELLRRLSQQGINGVWLHIVLSQIAPGTLFPEEAANAAIRLANLSKMAARANKYGIKIYLYLNEPRAQPNSWFVGKEGMKGVTEGNFSAICTSVPAVRDWIRSSLEHVFKTVPGLGGVFSISASENLTNCFSHNPSAGGCPRCPARGGAAVIAEINRTFAEGVTAGNPNAKVIVWDWQWQEAWIPDIIKGLPTSAYLMSVSEWGKPTQRGGINNTVGEYSISVIGPGTRALNNWALAKARGIKTIAKVQINNSWEMSAVPFLPVMNSIAQHKVNLNNANVDGMMLSWTLGGYPSLNLELVNRLDASTAPQDQVLSELANDHYGAAAGPDVVKAWKQFSDAFSEFPFDGSLIYNEPGTAYGPSNLLYASPTGYTASMIGFPYDDLNGWRSIYPAAVFISQFEKMAVGWSAGLATFKVAMEKTTRAEDQQVLNEDYRVAEAVGIHFQTVINQAKFVTARNNLAAGTLNAAQKADAIATVVAANEDEIKLARRMFTLTREDSRIGFEASNHYYYLPVDLVEKVINVDYIQHHGLPPNGAAYALAAGEGVKLSLNQNQPNPFTAFTSIGYSLPKDAAVILEILDSQGKRMRLLVGASEKTGAHQIIWNGLDESQNRVRAGVYLCRLKVGRGSMLRKIVLK